MNPLTVNPAIVLAQARQAAREEQWRTVRRKRRAARAILARRQAQSRAEDVPQPSGNRIPIPPKPASARHA